MKTMEKCGKNDMCIPIKKVLITGGAGFVGSNIAIYLKEKHKELEIISLDNLKRRGSEINLSRLKEHKINFVHGDVRNIEDLEVCFPVNVLIECSAEPSVQAGYDENPSYLLNTNLFGLLNCLELCRIYSTSIVFISTSRVYSINALRNLPLIEKKSRFDLPSGKKGEGWSKKGIKEDFPIHSPQSLYGATKYSAELFISEYAFTYGIKTIINRCGVLSGPWQMGKIDQGFVSLWANRFLYGGNLSYIGFGGHGKQVRDILHIQDFCQLIDIQLKNLTKCCGKIYNVGGGQKNSISLLELSELCGKMMGSVKKIKSNSKTHLFDIPFYISDNKFITSELNWAPKFSIETILKDIFSWLEEFHKELKPIFEA